jgi:hypothetical protein
MTAEHDPVLARRAKVARLTELGQRTGYTVLAVAVLLFAIGTIHGFTGPITAGITVSLGAGSLVLAPAIVFGFAVRAAEREDRQRAEHRRRAAGNDRE